MKSRREATRKAAATRERQKWAREKWERYLNAPRQRCPVCGGFNPGDMSHTRCAS